MSKQCGWIAPAVVAAGVVCGTWKRDGDVVRASWFNESGRPPRRALQAEVERLSSMIGRDLGASVSVV